MANNYVHTAGGVDSAILFVSNLANDRNSYYTFLSWPGEQPSPTPDDSFEYKTKIYDGMILGRRVTLRDFTLGVDKVIWSAGEVYDQYTDSAPTPQNTFVCVESDADYLVYRCLDNNNGSRSLVQPSGTSPYIFRTQEDGYTWKYLYTIPREDYARYATPEKMPVFNEPSVLPGAFDRAIEVVRVTHRGRGYNNHTNGEFPGANDIRIDGNDQAFGLANNAVPVTGYYNNCIIKITSGGGTGRYALITDYRVVDGTKRVLLDRPFGVLVGPGDRYEITPAISFVDQANTATTPCEARALVSTTSGNSIIHVEVLQPGGPYRNVTATVLADPSVGVRNQDRASVVPVISPKGGHGRDNRYDLDGSTVVVSSVLAGNTGPFIANNTFSTVGLIRDPLFNDVSMDIELGSLVGLFVPGEPVYRYKKLRLLGTCSIAANGLVTGSNTEFFTSLRRFDKIKITTGQQNVFGVVEEVIDNFTMNIATTSILDLQDCEAYYVEDVKFGEVVEVQNNELKLTNVLASGFTYSDMIYGERSFASASASQGASYVKIGTRPADEFNEFNQLTIIEGNLDTKFDFAQNESVSTTTGATGLVHSYRRREGPSLDELYLYSTRGDIITPTNITGTDTSSVFEATDKYVGDLVLDSGELIYSEQVDKIPRNNETSETFKLAIKF